MWRVFRGRQICKERADGKDPYDIDYTEPQRSVSESGVEYLPPLRPAANAPAVELGCRRLQDRAEPAPAPPRGR